MEQPNLSFFVTGAYAVAAGLTLLLLVASIWRARRAKRILAELEREDA